MFFLYVTVRCNNTSLFHLLFPPVSYSSTATVRIPHHTQPIHLTTDLSLSSCLTDPFPTSFPRHRQHFSSAHAKTISLPSLLFLSSRLILVAHLIQQILITHNERINTQSINQSACQSVNQSRHNNTHTS